MLTSSIARIVGMCTRYPCCAITCAVVLGILTSLYAATHFKIKTDVDALISPDLPWAQRAQSYARALPDSPILAVVDAPTSELTDQAAAKLEAALNAYSDQFRAATEE